MCIEYLPDRLSLNRLAESVSPFSRQAREREREIDRHDTCSRSVFPVEPIDIVNMAEVVSRKKVH